uniref:3-oxoacyl-[acyl-carrier-protein] synthase, mitochondrial-like n=1 Tax=Styela clava TaxID=7725 RepID=UPI00193AD271|nr:3-oxoacyl-[acyl-carrier-protein] synthase, mitochondrial-like [Styela clava]
MDLVCKKTCKKFLCQRHAKLFTIFSVRCYSRNVVVTGIGIVSPLGCGTQRVWERLINGSCGITNLKGEGYERISCKVAAYVPRNEFDEKLYVDRSKSMMSSYALAASDEALKDAKWKPTTEKEQWNTGVSIGVGMVELDYVCETGNNLLVKGPRSVSPHFVPRILLNLPAGEVAMRHHLKGPSHCVSTACATGAHAIGDAMRFIAHGDCDVMVAGATEACISPLGLAGFSQIRALAKSFNEFPEKASRPFDVDREGFVMGEGAAMLVLEEESHALARRANIYSRLAGYGLSGDAENIVLPSEGGSGAKRAMASAIQDSGFRVLDITYINAHATSTPHGDRTEAVAISTLFKNHINNLAVSSSKGAVGHLLGAAGAIEAAFTVLACHHSVLPPTLNLDKLDPNIHLDCVPLQSRSWKTNGLRVALSNSFGFGGTNAALCFTSV